MQGSFSVILLHVLLGALVTELGISILLMGKCFLFLPHKMSGREGSVVGGNSACFIYIEFIFRMHQDKLWSQMLHCLWLDLKRLVEISSTYSSAGTANKDTNKAN